MVHRIYPTELQLNKANASDTEAAFLDLNLSIHNDIVSTKIYDKRDDFNFDIVNFPFLDGDVPKLPSYGVYISQFIRFARASSHGTDFNNRNKFLTAKLLKQGNFSNLFKCIVNRFKRAGYSLDIMQQTACLVFNPIMVEGYAALFSCMAVVQASDSMTASM